MKKIYEEKLINDNLNLFRFSGKKILYKNIEEIWESVDNVIPLEPIQYGIECGDGWYNLLHNLLQNIKKHIENDYICQKFQHKFQITKNLQTILQDYKLYKLVDFVNKYSPKKKYKKIYFKITQIKSKYGGLRFYYEGGNDIIHGMIQFAQSFSWRICETCGTTNNVGMSSDWLEVICENCWKCHPKFDQRSWTKHNEYFYMY